MFPLDFGEFRVTRAKCVRHQPWKTARNSEFRKKLGNTKKKKKFCFIPKLFGWHTFLHTYYTHFLTYTLILTLHVEKMPKNRRPGTLKDFRILEKTLQKNSKNFSLVCKCLKNIHTHCCLLIFIQFYFFPCLFLFFRSLTIPEWSKPTLNVLPLSNTHPQMFSYHVLLFFYLFIFFSHFLLTYPMFLCIFPPFFSFWTIGTWNCTHKLVPWCSKYALTV